MYTFYHRPEHGGRRLPAAGASDGLLAGGHTLIPRSSSASPPSALIDLGGINDLASSIVVSHAHRGHDAHAEVAASADVRG